MIIFHLIMIILFNMNMLMIVVKMYISFVVNNYCQTLKKALFSLLCCKELY